MISIQDLLALLSKYDDSTKILLELPFDSNDVNNPESDSILTVGDLKLFINDRYEMEHVIAPTGVNIRLQPSINAPKIGVFDSNAVFDVSKYSQNGYRMIQAWVSEQYFKTVPVFREVYVSESGTNVRGGAGTSFTTITQLSQNTKLTVSTTTTSANGYDWAQIWHPTELAGNYIATKYLSDNPISPTIPVISGNNSKMGLHLLDPVGQDFWDFLTKCANTGVPVPGVTLLKSGNVSCREIKRISPKTEIVQRGYRGGDGSRDWTRTTYNDGFNDCQSYYNAYVGGDPDGQFADWHQIWVNEPGYDKVGTPAYWNGAIDFANSVGIRLAIFNFGVGIPDLPPNDGFWLSSQVQGLLNRVANSWSNPDSKGHGHILGMHQYANPNASGNNRVWTDLYYSQRQEKYKIYLPSGVRVVCNEFGDEKMIERGAEFYAQQLIAADNIMVGSVIRWTAQWTVITATGDASQNWIGDRMNPLFNVLYNHYITFRK